MDEQTKIQELKDEVQQFCEERDWDQFHGAKDLAIGISTEANELLDLFRFKSEEEVEEMFTTDKRQMIEDELSDVLVFVLRFGQKYNIDLTTAMKCKLQKGRVKYPVEKCKGSNKKYTEYE